MKDSFSIFESLLLILEVLQRYLSFFQFDFPLDFKIFKDISISLTIFQFNKKHFIR